MTDYRTTTNLHIILSIILYISCLFLPGYFVSGDYHPQMSSELLMTGWIGLLDGHFSWFANIFYFIALFNLQDAEASSKLSFFALFIALSFLLYDTVGGGWVSSTSITAYGLGYTLWITSIGLLAVGQMAITENKTNKYTLLVSLTWVSITMGVYTYYYFTSEKYTFDKTNNVTTNMPDTMTPQKQ